MSLSSGKFKDRREAGQLLAAAIEKLPLSDNNLVLGLPRGGVPIAYEIANGLNVPMDVFLVRKLGLPWHEELAMGAITLGDVVLLNETVISAYGITQTQIDAAIALETQELERRAKLYRKNKPPLNVQDKTVILVDDGIATGATIKVAIKALRKLGCEQLIVATPVAQPAVAHEISQLADEFICLMTPVFFIAIGQFYESFPQLSDEQVTELLSKKY